MPCVLMDPRDFRSLFRQMFGFPNHGGRSHDREDIYQEEYDPRYERPSQDGARSADPDQYNFTSRGFSVYTDPFEMNRFFDQQLDEMLKIFGHSFGFGSRNGEGQFGGFGHGNSRMIPLEPESEPECPSTARDFMWREDSRQPRVDTEVDSDTLDMRELDELMKNRNHPVIPRQEQRPHNMWDLFATQSFERRDLPGPSSEGSSFYSFGSSMSQRSVSGPNGSVETTRTVRNSDGSEVITVTKQLGDKSYEVVTNRDRDGTVSTEERLVNISEQELDKFKVDLREKKELGSQPRDDMMTAPPYDQLLPSLWKKFFDD